MSNFTKLKLCHTFGISRNTHFWVKGALTALLLVLCGNVAKAQSDLTFNEGIRYSQWVINSRLGDFYGNTNDFGFTTYNRDLSVKKEVTKWKGGSKDPYIDYVAGLVAKATIEAADYYKNYDWSKPWFKSVEWYGNQCTVPNAPDNLDAINASKMYFGISSLANGSFKSIVEQTTAKKIQDGLKNALTALRSYNTNHAFPANSSLNSHDISGGWYHKNEYAKQMWLDGQYMGPAVLAQLINDYKTCTDTEYTAISSSDWNLITKQFTIVWQQCWDSTEKLLYHAFSSEPLNYWTSDPEIWETAKTSTSKWTSMTSAGHSAGFWGRAEGWYFLALVDVLEQMQIAKVTNSDNYTILHGYLVELANGIKARQDANSGCWYQILNKDNTYTAHYYAGKSSSKANYLESSCTAIFTAAYLKAIRLGLLSEETYKATAEAGYKGLIKQFMKQQSDGTVQLFGCCKSAGLGTSTTFGDAKFRDGSNAYYLLGDDVPATTDYTEGKVLGAFILAATEYERKYQNTTLLAKDLNPSYSIKSGEAISVEVLGDVTPTYQWYNASTGQAVSGAQDASFTPATSGKYYCKITVKPATSAKTRATSDGTYEITTRATDVTVEGTSTGGGTGSAVNVTEIVTFPNETTKYEMAPSDATKIEVTATGVNSNSKYLLTGYTGFIKMDSSGSIQLSIPPTASNINVTLLSQSSVSSLKLNSNSGTNTTWSGDATNGYKYSFSIDDNLAGTTYTISKGNGISYIHKITITYTLGSSSETTKSNDATATFTYNGNNLTFTGDVATIDLESTQAGSEITINATPAAGATISATSGNNTSISENVITIIAPAAGSNANYIYTVTAEDGTTAKTYTINVNVAAPVLYTVTLNAGTNGTCSTTSLKQESAGASITLPDATPNEGYTFDGWYTAAEGGNKVGSPYTPKDNITLYAHYTSTVSGPYVKFTTQPQGALYVKGTTPKDLSVEATTNVSNVTISYQWYSNTTSSTEGGTAIYGEKKSTYTPSTATTGTTYYYCVASVTSGSETTISATSNIVSVEVVGEIYSVKVYADSSTPKCNESWYIKGKSGENLVKMTFGGWKWGTNAEKNNHTYLRPNKEDIAANYITDAWKAPAKQDKVNALDGYEYAIAGLYDAVHEDKTAVTPMYGKDRYGWFVSPTRNENGITTASYPFTLPVRGAYMTFEPTQNGTLTIYLLQNGAWNSDTENKIDIIPGEFRMHAFQITNQRGLVLEEFAPQYKITVNQKVMDGYTCSKYAKTDKPSTFNKDSKDIKDWEEFWDLDDDERKAVHDNWANGTNGSQTIIKLKNGSFLAIQKAIVKYQFHVTGNETYYMFSNFSKLGFSGATFQPDDAQPTDVTTFSGDNSLSDDKAYTKINATKLETTIQGSNLNDYKYTIGEGESAPEVGKVDGVFIPQFKAITLNRTFKKDQWTTLTLPFNLTEDEVQSIFGAGTRLVMLHDATLQNEGAHLTFIYHEIQNVLPGYPYLIKPTLKDITNDAHVSVTKANNTITSFTVYGKCINPFIKQFEVKTTPYTFKGTPGYCTADKTNNGKTGYSVKYAENDIFVSEGNGNLYVSGGSSYGKGYRAWLENTKNGSTTSVKSISVVMSSFSDDDDTTTSIDVAEMAPDLIEALGIQTGVYNLSGQRVANDTRNLKAGIYIVNGKKTVVR